MLLSKCTMCNSKKTRFIKKKEADKLLTSLGLKTPLRKFHCFRGYLNVNIRYKMNKIINNFLLAGGKIMSKMHLMQPGLSYSAGKPFTKERT